MQKQVEGGTTGGGIELTKLSKNGSGAYRAASVLAKIIWLVSGATVTLNFLRKSMPRIGPAKAAYKKFEVNRLPGTGQFF
jgi:hypothetical protein